MQQQAAWVQLHEWEIAHTHTHTPTCLDDQVLEKVCLSLLIILTQRVKSRCLPAQPVQAPSVWPGDQSQAALGHNHTCQLRARRGGGKFDGGVDVSEDLSKCLKGQKGERIVEVKDD